MYIAAEGCNAEGDYFSSEIARSTSGSGSSRSDLDALFDPNMRINPRRKQSDTVVGRFYGLSSLKVYELMNAMSL